MIRIRLPSSKTIPQEEEEEDESRRETLLTSSSLLLAAKLHSNDHSDIVSALNTLLVKSADHDANFSVENEGGEGIVDGLVFVFDKCLGWTGCRCDDDDDDGSEEEQEEKKRLSDNHKKNISDDDLTPSASSWVLDRDDTPAGSWAAFCQAKFSSSSVEALTDADDVHLLAVVLMIIRNISYVAGNVRYLVQSSHILRLLSGCLYYRQSNKVITPANEQHWGSTTGAAAAAAAGTTTSSTTSTTTTNLCQLAIQTLINLAPHMDITGRKVFVDRTLLSLQSEQINSKTTGDHTASVTQSYGQANLLGWGGMLLAKRYYENRDETLSKIPNYIVQGLVSDYIRTTISIFPALIYTLDCDVDSSTEQHQRHHLVQQQQQRSVILSTLELLKELLDNTDTHSIFVHTPDTLLSRLVHFLWVPRLGPDSLDYMDPICNVVTRVSTLKLLTGYDATIDFELRDRSTEILVQLTNLSPDLKRRVGRRRCRSTITATTSAFDNVMVQTTKQHNARLYESLLSMIRTKVGRNDASTLACQLLANLVMVPENLAGIMYIERRLINVASYDPNVANLLCNGVLKSTFSV